MSGTNIFAGTDNGVFLSNNYGYSWTAKNTGLTNTNVKSLALSGTNIFAGTDGGVFLSTNNGNNYTAVNNGLTNTNIKSLVISGSNIFAGTDGGVFLSTNNGSSWTAVNNGLTNTYIKSLVISGTNIFAGTDGGVFLSTNNGSSWTAVNNGLTNTYIKSLAISGTNIFAGTDGGVFLSTNNGSSWTAVNNGLTNTYIKSLVISGTNIFAGTTGGGVFKSTDNGSSWTAVNNGFPAGSTVFSLVTVGQYIYAGTFGEGIYKTMNNGSSWAEINSSWNTFFAITHIEPNPCEINSYYTQEYLISTNGIVWDQSNSKRGIYRIYIKDGGELTINSEVSLIEGGKIIVEDGGILNIGNGGKLYNTCNTSWDGIEVNDGGILNTTGGSNIILSGNGKILIDGVFNYNEGTIIDLSDENTNIEIKGVLNIGQNANFTFTGSGYIKFSSPNWPSNNITYGTGSSVTLSGSGQSDKIIEIAQETVYMPNCTLSNGLVYMQHPNARMQAATETTTMNLDNIKFSPPGTTRTQQRGLQVWGNQYCTINNCTFENGQYGIYAYLSYGGNSLSVSNSTFTNNAYGIWVHDKSFNLSNCTFTKNDYGVYAENTSVNNSKIDNCYFTGNPNRNKYPIRYINCDGGLSIENSQIYDADATSLYSINSSGNYNLKLYCTTVSVPGTSTYALNLANGASLTMSTNTSRSGSCNIIATAPIRLTNAYNINIDNGYNYLNKSGGYHVYGNITAYACSGMPSLYFRNNQWNGTITNQVKNNNCSPVQYFTLVTSPTATYTSCNNKSLIIENNQTNENSTQIMDYAEDTHDWQTPFDIYAQTFAGNVPEANQQNVEIWENSWENMRFCLKKMYGLKQLNGISNSEFNRTMAANHKMQQLQRDNYYRLFQLKLEKATLYRMAGNYDKAIELVSELTSDTCSSHKEQADAWLCMLQLEKRVAQGLIPTDRIEKERANCPMFQEPSEEQTKSSQNNSPEMNIESSSWIKIVPNPASEQVTLCVNSESENPCEVEITNVLGKHIETISIDEGYSETVVPLDKYSKGIYIASLIKNGKKVVIQRFSVVK